MAANTVEELEKQYQTNNNKTTTTTTTTTTTLPKYEAQTDAVNKVYDTANSASMAALENAYNQSKAQAEAAAQKIPATYQAQANAVAAQSERDKQAFRETAGASGLNVGTGSQAALAQNNQLQSDLTRIRTAEADAKQDMDNRLNQLYITYQGSIAEALANNEYERANALLGEYKQAASSAVTVAQNQATLDRQWEQTQYNRNLQNAETLAKYGDFSGYKNLGYNDAQIAAMQAAWAYANPELARVVGSAGLGTGTGTGTGAVPPGYETPDGYVPPEGGDTVTTVTGSLPARQAGESYDAYYARLLNSGYSRADIIRSVNAEWQTGNMTPEMRNSLVDTYARSALTYEEGRSVVDQGKAQGIHPRIIIQDINAEWQAGRLTDADRDRLVSEVLAEYDLDADIPASSAKPASTSTSSSGASNLSAYSSSYYSQFLNGAKPANLIADVEARWRRAEISTEDKNALVSRINDWNVQRYANEYSNNLAAGANRDNVNTALDRRVSEGKLTQEEATRVTQMIDAYNRLPTDWVMG